MMKTIDPTSTPAWSELHTCARDVPAIADLIQTDRAFLRMDACGVSFDFSRQRVDPRALKVLVQLAGEVGVEQWRAAMFAGEHINTTEDRAVLHTALRLPATALVQGPLPEVVPAVHEVLDRMAVFAEGIRTGERPGSDGRRITDVVNIGIGGSDLGPAMAYRALRNYRHPDIRCHFVSNVDPADLDSVLEHLDARSTLFIIASKTFTTQETMANARRARSWVVTSLSESAVTRHFVAVSTNADAVASFGIEPSAMFGFWDWVGGRYSMTSAIGLSTMISIGPVNYRALLDGFAGMDEHFRTAPAVENVPVLMGLLAVWNRNFLDIPTTAVLPYSHDLARFPAYLQQLCMESNGKSVRRDGTRVDYATGGIVWGEPGTNGQHSFHQLLHQGTDDVAVDIIVVASAGKVCEPSEIEQQDMLVANALAQAAVLSLGITEEELRESGTPEPLVAHKVMAGDRPTSVIMVPELTPFTLGVLIAAYEHSVFVQGAIWQIDSFDQWGVELGKHVATDILQDIRDGSSSDPRLDPATRASLDEFLGMRRATR